MPSGARLLLVRHGEAVCNAEGLLGGPRGDGGLTELGRAQARVLAARLSSSRELRGASAYYCSTLPRAIETADLLQAAIGEGTVAVRDAEIRELDPGESDGLQWEELVARYAIPDWDVDPDAPIAPGGDSWTGFTTRAWDALTRLARTHDGELAVVVTHGGVIEAAIKLVYGVPASARLRLRTDNCSMTELEARDGAWHLLRYNDRAPLPAREE
jgi:2,3-bisphosphoglycerate-dependent phosphoglycerate mutase